MASTNPWDCICGYPGSSEQDLDEHLTAAAPLGPEGAHRPASSRVCARPRRRPHRQAPGPDPEGTHPANGR